MPMNRRFRRVAVLLAVTAIPPLASSARAAWAVEPTSDVLVARAIGLDVAAMVGSPTGNRLYAVTTAASVVAPSSVVIVDGALGAVTGEVALPSPASVIEISDDGTALYVGGGADPLIRQYDAATLAPTRSFAAVVPGSAQGAPIIGMAALPGSPGSLAVIAGEASAPNRIVVFDAGEARPQVALSGADGFAWIEAGATSQRLYALDAGGGFSRVAVAPNGASLLERTTGFAAARMSFRAGRIYTDGDQVIDAEAHTLVRAFGSGMVTRQTTFTRSGDYYIVGCTHGGWRGLGQSCSLARLTAADGTVVATYTNTDLMIRSGLDVPALAAWGTSGAAIAYDGRLYLGDPAAQIGAAGEYHPLDPVRVLDTRLGLGAARAPIGAGATLAAQVTGVGGVPPAAQVSAVVLNVTVTSPTSDGYLSVWPSGTPKTSISSVNFRAGETVPNLVTVPVGADGKVSIFNERGSADVLLDVSGYYSTVAGTAGSRFHPVVPDRLVDTRIALGLPGSPIGTVPVDAQVTGSSGVPLAGPTAVALNVTVTNPTASGYLSVYPAGIAPPVVSNLNFSAGRTVANTVIVRTAPGGLITLANSAGTADVIIDIVGYFDDTRTGEQGRFYPVLPYRTFDSRLRSYFGGPEGRASNGESAGFLPPGWASVAVVNLTATGAFGGGYLTAAPSTAASVPTSSVNYEADRSTPNQVIVKADVGGTDAYLGSPPYSRITASGQPVHIIIDTLGGFT